MKKLILFIGLLAVVVFLGVYQQRSSPVETETIQVLSATKPAGLFTYRLSGAGISSSASSFTLNSLTLPQNDYPIQDADVSDTFFITIEPGSTDRQEFVSCTTIGSNTGGTVTISGCTRGLSPITPYTASSTLQFAHSGASAVIFSDAPGLFNEFAAKGNSETITGAWNFATAPTSSDECSTSTEYCTRGYVDLQVAAGFSASNVAANSGLITLGTAPETLSILLSTANSAVLSGLATSSNRLIVNTGYGLTVASDNKLEVATSTANFTWAGNTIFTGNFNVSTKVATSTLALWVGSGGTADNIDLTGGDIYVQDDVEVDGSISLGGVLMQSWPDYLGTSTASTTVSGINATSTVLSQAVSTTSLGRHGILKFFAHFYYTDFDSDAAFADLQLGTSVFYTHNFANNESEEVWLEGTIFNLEGPQQRIFMYETRCIPTCTETLFRKDVNVTLTGAGSTFTIDIDPNATANILKFSGYTELLYKD